MKLIISILLTVIYTAILLSGQSQNIGLEPSDNSYINFQVNYQIMLLGVALISLVTSYILNPDSFKSFVSFGHISAPSKAVKLMGIKEGDNWLKTGLSLSIVISLVTITFMYFQLKGRPINYALLKTGIPWIILFALTNAFAEEAIYRIGINGPLKGLLSPEIIFLISAIIFGFAHIKGMPNGLTGILMAGLMGYLLSKSLHETNGIFWAWFIHFLQDVIIIGAVFLLKSS